MTGAPAISVLGVGAAVPSGRLDAAEVAHAWSSSSPYSPPTSPKAAMAVCGPDEDSLTLAWRAAKAAMDAASVSEDEIDGMWWGSSRLPMAEGPSYAYLAAALHLNGDIAGLVASGSAHAGMDALDSAWDALAAGAVGTALVVASDAQVPGLGTGSERATGAGAVALVVRCGDGGPAVVTRRALKVRPVLDRYRGSEQSGTGDPYDARLYREKELLPALTTACEALGPIVSGTRFSLPDPDGRLGQVVAKAVGASEVVSEGLVRSIGTAGSASPLLGALRALSSPGPLCIVAEGGGRSSAWLIEVRSAVPGSTAAVEEIEGKARATRPLSYLAVLRARGQLTPLSEPVPMGVPPGSAAFVRGNEELLGLTGRKCGGCSTIAVPPSIHPVCPTCGNAEGALVKLARSGRIQTFVVNHTMPPPFEAPLPICVVDLDDGARVMLQGMPEDASGLAVGDRVVLELRRYAIERGAPVYGFKVRKDK